MKNSMGDTKGMDIFMSEFKSIISANSAQINRKLSFYFIMELVEYMKSFRPIF